MFHVEQSRELVEVLGTGAKELGIPLQDAQIQAFGLYLRELTIWNKKTNLTAVRTDREILVKHFLDSLAYSKVLLPLRAGSTLLDIGSGAGFPGLPLKLFLPELRVILLEPSLKKTAFLRHIIGSLHLHQIEAISQRIEDFSKDSQRHGVFDWATTRAVKAESIVPSIGRILSKEGKLILGRTSTLDFSPESYGLRLVNELSFNLPFGLGTRVLTVLEATANA